jgi:hypothetical protein
VETDRVGAEVNAAAGADDPEALVSVSIAIAAGMNVIMVLLLHFRLLSGQ